MGKGENVGNLQCFQILERANFKFSVGFILSSANALNMDQSNFVVWKRVILSRTHYVTKRKEYPP